MEKLRDLKKKYSLYYLGTVPFLFYGLWPIHADSLWKRLLYAAFQVFVIVNVCYIYLGYIIQMTLLPTGTGLMMRNLGLGFTMGLHYVPFLPIVVQRRRLQGLAASLPLGVPADHPQVRRANRTQVAALTVALVEMVYTFLAGVFLSFTTRSERVFPCWYPLDDSNLASRVFICLHQQFGASALVFVQLGFFCYYANSIILIQCHYDVLQEQVRELRESAWKEIGNLEGWDPEAVNGPVVPAYHAALDRRLGDCIKYHQMIIRACQDLTDAMSSLLVAHFVISVATLSFNIFAALSVQEFTVLVLIQHAVCVGDVLTWLLILCWYGEELRHKAWEVKNAFYDCGWQHCRRSFKLTIQTALAFCNQEVVLKGGGFIVVNLHTAVTLVQEAFSYFMVMINLTGDRTGVFELATNGTTF